MAVVALQHPDKFANIFCKTDATGELSADSLTRALSTTTDQFHQATTTDHHQASCLVAPFASTFSLGNVIDLIAGSHMMLKGNQNNTGQRSLYQGIMRNLSQHLILLPASRKGKGAMFAVTF